MFCLRFQRCVEKSSSVTTVPRRDGTSNMCRQSVQLLDAYESYASALSGCGKHQSKCHHLVCVHFSCVQMETPDGTQNVADRGYFNGCLRHSFLRRT